MTTDTLTDEQFAAIWGGGDTASLASFESSNQVTSKTPEELEAEKVAQATQTSQSNTVIPKNVTEVKDIKESDITDVFTETDDTEEDDESDTTTTQTDQTQNDPKRGRKPSDLVTLIGELIDEDILLGESDPSDDTKIIKPKTNAEAKALIKANLDEREKTVKLTAKEEFKKEYSPQIQAVLHYADQGAQSATELMELLGAIKEVEDTNDYDIATTEGQVNVIRDSYKARGFKDNFIEKQINRLKDLGGEHLKTEADDLLPELAEIKSRKVEDIIAKKAEKEKDAEKASKIYTSTIQEVLNKETLGGLKLEKAEKAKIYQSLAKTDLVSLNGKRTNAFVKKLEELQFGENKNYEHFLRIVYLAMDEAGFDEKNKIAATIQVASETEKKLRSAKSLNSNSSSDDIQRSNTNKKKLPRAEFVNPYT